MPVNPPRILHQADVEAVMAAKHLTLEADEVHTERVTYSTLFTNSTLLASGEHVESGWLDFQTLNVVTLLIARASTPDIYSFEIDWSSDGITSDVTEGITIINSTSVSKTVAARYGKIRISNTDLVASFTVHTTVVTGR